MNIVMKLNQTHKLFLNLNQLQQQWLFVCFDLVGLCVILAKCVLMTPRTAAGTTTGESVCLYVEQDTATKLYRCGVKIKIKV